jgi:hypothetical protein
MRKERLSFDDLHDVAFPHHVDSLLERRRTWFDKEGREHLETDEMVLARWLPPPSKKQKPQTKAQTKAATKTKAETKGDVALMAHPNRFHALRDAGVPGATGRKDKGKEKLQVEDDDDGDEREVEETDEPSGKKEGKEESKEESEADDGVMAEEEGDDEEIRQIEEERTLLEAMPGANGDDRRERQVEEVNFADLATSDEQQLPSREVLEMLNLWSLSHEDRSRLHFYWLRQYKTELKEKMLGLCARYEVLCQERKEIEAALQLAKIRDQAVGTAPSWFSKLHV